MFKKWFVWILAGLVLFFIGCGGGRERAAEKAAEKAIAKETGKKADVDISKEKVTIKSEEGEVTITEKGGASIPENFPKDVYIYAGAPIKISSKQDDSFMLVLESKDDVKKVINEYKDKMKSEGWDAKTTLDMGVQTMLEFRKDNRATVLNVMKEDDKTTIHIMVSIEKESK